MPIYRRIVFAEGSGSIGYFPASVGQFYWNNEEMLFHEVRTSKSVGERSERRLAHRTRGERFFLGEPKGYSENPKEVILIFHASIL